MPSLALVKAAVMFEEEEPVRFCARVGDERPVVAERQARPCHKRPLRFAKGREAFNMREQEQIVRRKIDGQRSRARHGRYTPGPFRRSKSGKGVAFP